MGDQKYEEEENAAFEDEKSSLQLNRKDKDSGIQPWDAIPKWFHQDWLIKPIPGTQ